MSIEPGHSNGAPHADANDEVSVLDIIIPLARHLKLLVFGSLMVGALALGITFLITPTFTARTLFLPPQQQQSAAASVLASLGALSGLVDASANVKSPADQYVALMRSNTIANRIIDKFKLIEVYDVEYRDQARKKLDANVRMSVGKKDGLITVEIDDIDPERAAAMANLHVDELRRISSELALTEAQQRRTFFEQQLKQTNERLVKAQEALQSSGFNAGALKTEPKSAAERFARLQAEVTAAEVQLQTLRRSLADAAPEVQQQLTRLSALRQQVDKSESVTTNTGNSDYVSKYRDFKYEEALFEVFSRQYEMARLDEAREGVLIQVVDPALPPERKSHPKRALTAIAATLAAFVILSTFVLARDRLRRSAEDPTTAEKVEHLRAALNRHPHG